MKLAICSPIYNGLQFTKEFIGSITTKADYRLIIFNNGSSDGSVEWLSCNNEISRRLTVLNSVTNLGVSIGANRALQEAMSDPSITHIIYANNDIIFRPDTIDALIWAWDNRQEEKMVRVSAVDIRENHFHSYNAGFEEVMNRKCKRSFIYGGSYTCFIWDKQAIEKVGLLDENVDYYDDNIHAEEVLRRGYFSTTYIPALIYHRGSGTMRLNPKERQAFDIKFNNDREYAFKFFGVRTQEGIREVTERGRAIWTPRITEINEKLFGGEKSEQM